MNYLKRNGNPLKLVANLLTLPIIFLPLPFFIFLDLVIEFYHRTCFPVYGIEYVKRGLYIKVIDRAKLDYLDWPQKIGCMYCGYANGVLLFLKEVAGRTEKYWCGIMHEDKKGLIIDPNHIQNDFAKYNDEQDFNKKYN
jgi:hypothetical protein